MHRDLLAGVHVAMVTPFDASDAVRPDALAANVERLNRTGLRGYWVNGEFRALSVEERLLVLRTVLACRAPGKVVIAGCGAESTREAIEVAVRAAALGAELASLSMPSAFSRRVTVEVMEQHVLAVADAAPIPVVLYNNPAHAGGVTIRLELLRRVASHPNVVAIKDSARETVRESLRAASPGFCVLAGSPEFTLEVLRCGGTGAILSLANVLPVACVRLYDAFREGRAAEAEELSQRLAALYAKISGAFGVAGVKAAMDAVGLFGGTPRRPYPTLDAAQAEALRRTIEESGLAEQ